MWPNMFGCVSRLVYDEVKERAECACPFFSAKFVGDGKCYQEYTRSGHLLDSILLTFHNQGSVSKKCNLPSRQINDFSQKGNTKIVLVARPGVHQGTLSIRTATSHGQGLRTGVVQLRTSSGKKDSYKNLAAATFHAGGHKQ